MDAQIYSAWLEFTKEFPTLANVDRARIIFEQGYSAGRSDGWEDGITSANAGY